MVTWTSDAPADRTARKFGSRSSSVSQGAVESTRSESVKACSLAQNRRPAPAVRRQDRPFSAAPGARSGTIWSPCTRDRGSRNRSPRSADRAPVCRTGPATDATTSPIPARRVGLIQPVGGAQRDIGGGRARPNTTSAPIHQAPSSTAAVCQWARQQHRDPAARAGPQFVAQQIRGLGGPVGQRHGRTPRCARRWRRRSR